MECPSCHHLNRPKARFCQNCGALLPIASESSIAATQQQVKAASSPRPSIIGLPGTAPLPAPPPRFQPLPVGALLCQDRYAVCEIRPSEGDDNIYLVEDLIPTHRCPNCAADVVAVQTRFCTECGADLTNVPAVHLRYLMQESDQERAFAMEAHWLNTGLQHPGIYLPVAAFEEMPYSVIPRYYRIVSEFMPTLATELPIPQELPDVLKWGVVLADALDCLHQHKLMLENIPLERIAVNGGTAQWLDLNLAKAMDKDGARQARRDVHGLAQVLLYLATGQKRGFENIALPDAVAQTFDHALDLSRSLSAAEFTAALDRALQTLRKPHSISFLIGQCTDVGKVRSLNEDSLLALDIAPVFRSQNRPVGVFLIADGMGGHEAGDVASQLAARLIAQRAASEILAPAAAGQPLPDARAWLTDVVGAANKQVFEQRRRAGNDMGTTLVLALCVGDTCTIANVGDSRAYLLTPGGITQLTTDHSLVERLVATGQLSRAEAAEHPQKNVIYRVMGDKPKIDVDVDTQTFIPGEALLLCSDGLSGMLPDERIRQIWQATLSPQEACEHLIEAANQAGGEDNISVIIVQISE